MNDTRVVPARLLGRKADTHGRVEIFLVRRLGEVALDAHTGAASAGERWEALGRSSKALRRGMEIELGPEHPSRLRARVIEERGDGDDGALLEVALFSPTGASVETAIGDLGHVPLPPYLRRSDDAADRERYQTVFARSPGAVAAPTAGLHLSHRLLEKLEQKGIERAAITLHVGLGTFQPVTAADLDDHHMHVEAFEVSEAAASAIERARARSAPVVAIGTTVARALESAADPSMPGCVRAMRGETNLLDSAWIPIPRHRSAPHELPLAAIDAARAGRRLRRDRARALRIPRRDRRTLSVLQLRRRDAPHAEWTR